MSFVASPAAQTTFFVGPNASGRWVVRETRGLIEGVFISRREALRFALFESGGRPGAVIISSSFLETQIA